MGCVHNSFWWEALTRVLMSLDARHLACASVFFSLVPPFFLACASLFVSLVSPVLVNWDMFDDHC